MYDYELHKHWTYDNVWYNIQTFNKEVKINSMSRPQSSCQRVFFRANKGYFKWFSDFNLSVNLNHVIHIKTKELVYPLRSIEEEAWQIEGATRFSHVFFSYRLFGPAGLHGNSSTWCTIDFSEQWSLFVEKTFHAAYGSMFLIRVFIFWDLRV